MAKWKSKCFNFEQNLKFGWYHGRYFLMTLIPVITEGFEMWTSYKIRISICRLTHKTIRLKCQKWPSRGDFRKRCSENMQQICRSRPIPTFSRNTNVFFALIPIAGKCRSIKSTFELILRSEGRSRTLQFH